MPPASLTGVGVGVRGGALPTSSRRSMQPAPWRLYAARTAPGAGRELDGFSAWDARRGACELARLREGLVRSAAGSVLGSAAPAPAEDGRRRAGAADPRTSCLDRTERNDHAPPRRDERPR